MSNTDIASLWDRGSILQPGEEEEENPIRSLWRGSLHPSAFAVDRETLGSEFAKGIGRGAIYPIRSFIGRGQSESVVQGALSGLIDPNTEVGVAGMAGEFVGMGLSFLPLFRGAQVVTAGVGVLKTAPRLARLVESSLSFAGFEAFAGESPSEAPKRALIGLAEGAAFDAAFMGMGLAWRSRFPTKVIPQVERDVEAARKIGAKIVGKPESEIALHPTALLYERIFAPKGETLEQTVKMLEAVQDPEANLYQAIVRITNDHMPSGHLALPAPTAKDMADVRKIGRGLGYEVITFNDPETKQFINLFVNESASLLKIKDANIQRKFFAAGDPIWTPAEAIKIIEEVGQLRVRVHGRQIPGQSRTTGGVFYDPIAASGQLKTLAPEESLIRLGYINRHNLDSITEQGYVGLIVHEYTHALHSMGVRTSGRRGTPWSLRTLARRMGLKNDEVPLDIIKEMEEATIAVRAKQLAGGESAARSEFELARNLERKATAKADDIRFSEYLHNDEELIARLGELMFLDPAMAKKVAPRASRLMARYISRNAPKMKELMTKEVSALDDVMREYWVRRGGELTIWTEGAPKITARLKKQFEKDGFYEGMPILADGKWGYFVGRGAEKTVVQMAAGGKPIEVPNKLIQRPLASAIAKTENRVMTAIDGLLETETPKWIPFNHREGQAIRRGIVDLEEFEVISGWGGYMKWAKENGLNPNYLERTSTQAKLRQLNKKGLYLYDSGFMEVVIADDAAIMFGERASLRFLEGGQQANTLIDQAGKILSINNIQPDDVLRSLLREQGVLEHDLPAYLHMARERLGNRLRGLLDPETRKLVEGVESRIAGTMDDGLESAATRAGFEIVNPGNGTVEVRDAASKSVLGRFVNEEEADEYIRLAGLADDGPPIADIPGIGGVGGNGGPPPFQAQFPGGGADDIMPRVFKLSDTMNLLASWTARENFAKWAERTGLGPVYNRIFLPGQRVSLEVDRHLTRPLQALEGKSYVDGLGELANRLRKVKKGRFPVIQEFTEYMSKDEISKAGGLLQRDMTVNEIRVADFIESVGLGTSIPRLMSTERLIQSAIAGRPKLDQTIRQLRRVELSPEVEELIAVFEGLPRFKNRDDIIKALGMTQEEVQVLKVISDSVAADKDKFSIFAVSRYATARKLDTRFKTGREQFAAERGMTAAEVGVADQFDRLMQATFGAAGLDPRRQIGGYFPHMRLWARDGWTPLEAGQMAGLPKEFIEWSHDRFRSGELDVYSVDPFTTAFKYIRGMLMKKEFDPLLPDMYAALREVKDKRVYEVMSAYIDELKGIPHDSYRRLQDTMEKVMGSMFGKDVAPGLARNVVSAISSVATAATLPFRASVILRNYVEMSMKIPPRVGMGYFKKALTYVVSPETRKEAFESALAAGAVTPRTQTIRALHGAEEMFGERLTKMGYMYQLIFDKGLKWYQSGDDFGRAIAFHAQKFRMADEFGKFQKGQQSFDKFVENSKMLTFDPLDIDIAVDLIKKGQFEDGSNHLGFILARETMTRYGHANSPHGWNSVAGRLLGQFGTWPVQYKDFLFQGLSRGTAKDRIEFAASHFGVSGAMLLGGYAGGVNLASWMAFPSLFYTGGPLLDVGINVARSLNGSEAEKSLARYNLMANAPVLGWMKTGNPRSIFLPGSYFLGDVVDAWNAPDLFTATLEGTGFRAIRPDQRTAIDWFMDQ